MKKYILPFVLLFIAILAIGACECPYGEDCGKASSVEQPK